MRSRQQYREQLAAHLRKQRRMNFQWCAGLLAARETVDSWHCLSRKSYVSSRSLWFPKWFLTWRFYSKSSRRVPEALRWLSLIKLVTSPWKLEFKAEAKTCEILARVGIDRVSNGLSFASSRLLDFPVELGSQQSTHNCLSLYELCCFRKERTKGITWYSSI